ncbi:MAG TPA: type II toxin-antitoxin system VapB family antitoxin [Geminicoccaceae bacterium]|nr:type II toxin-antitoxin system VapB family antitoxin [Geminicoccaceae bacterium]
MALSIKDPEADRLARALAAATGESLTRAVTEALRERLERVGRRRAGRFLADELNEIALRCAALPDLDTRTPDEIIGYDEHGLPR